MSEITLLHCCVVFNITFNSWSWCYDFYFCSSLATSPSPSFCHSCHFTSTLHFPAQRPFLFQIKYIFIHCFALFWHCHAARKCFAKQQMDYVCVHVCVSERSKSMCVCYLPPGCPEYNCPECSLCLVMACCYLPPCCAEKKWLSNIVAFHDEWSLIYCPWHSSQSLFSFKMTFFYGISAFLVYSNRNRKCPQQNEWKLIHMPISLQTTLTLWICKSQNFM